MREPPQMNLNRSAKLRSLILLEMIILLLCIPSFHHGLGNDTESEKDPLTEILIIAHPTAVDNTLKPDQIRDIFLGNKTKWNNGKKITFFILKKGRTHESFLKRFVHKSAIQFTKFWRYQVFTGKGRAPKSLSSESKLIDYVSRTEGSIGYISVKEAQRLKIFSDERPEKRKVKVIKILKDKEESEK